MRAGPVPLSLQLSERLVDPLKIPGRPADDLRIIDPDYVEPLRQRNAAQLSEDATVPKKHAKLTTFELEFDPLLLNGFNLAPVPQNVVDAFSSLQMVVRSNEDRESFDNHLNTGWMFHTSHNTRTNTLIELCSRSFAQLEMEHRLYFSLPVAQTTPEFTERSISLLHQWLAAEMEMDPGEDFKMILNDMVAELMIPAGARTKTSRVKNRMSFKQKAQQILTKELGVDVVTQLGQEMQKIDWLAVARDSKHLYFDVLLLCYFAHSYQNETSLPFLSKYLVMPSRLLTERSAQKDLTSEFTADQWRKQKRTPRISRLLDQWLICDQQQWHTCRSVSHLVLTWLWLVRAHHNSKIETDQSIGSFIELFTIET